MKDREDLLLGKNEIIMAEVASANQMRNAILKIKNNLEFNRSRVGDL